MHAVHPTPRFTPAGPATRLPGIALIACAHILLIIGLWQLSRVPLRALAEPVLSVFLVPSAEPALPAEAPALRVDTPPSRLPAPALNLPLPVLRDTAPAATAPAETAPAMVDTPVPRAATPAAPAAPVPQAAAAPAPPPAVPPPRRQVSGSAVRYLVLPPVEVPRASRRAGEHGTVWLRVVVDAAGLPVLVSVQRSSGYARLDEQALSAMRQARFKPHTEDGHAVEVEVIAPIEYPAD